MQALWIGAETELTRTVLVSLQSRWPDARICRSQSALEAAALIEGGKIDVVFVHLCGAGAADAFACVRAIRAGSDIAILALAEEANEMERVKALYWGCDSVIPANCGLLEIQAQTVAVLRRARSRRAEAEAPIQLGPLQISPATHVALLRGRQVNLTPIEFKLLCVLAQQKGSVATHAMLLRAIWGDGIEHNVNLLRKYVQRLRSKLGDDAEQPNWIVNLPGIGYRMLNLDDIAAARG